MMQPSYSLTEEDQYLLRYVYCIDLGRNYVALRNFIAQHGRYPSERGEGGKKLKANDPERRLCIFVDTIKRNWPEPAGRQLMEKVPGWTWNLT